MILALPIGRIAFGVCFAIVFIVLAALAYRKDAKYHSVYYKKVGIGMLIGILVFFVAMWLFVSH